MGFVGYGCREPFDTLGAGSVETACDDAAQSARMTATAVFMFPLL
jgi:hypothetical protein